MAAERSKRTVEARNRSTLRMFVLPEPFGPTSTENRFNGSSTSSSERNLLALNLVSIGRGIRTTGRSELFDAQQQGNSRSYRSY